MFKIFKKKQKDSNLFEENLFDELNSEDNSIEVWIVEWDVNKKIDILGHVVRETKFKTFYFEEDADKFEKKLRVAFKFLEFGHFWINKYKKEK